MPPKWTGHLLRWYGQHKRDLPWRRTSDPYAIWISEIMLQQTTVEAVIPYYERFLKRFPDVFALAEGPEEDVLKLWAGLGYYSRARNLFKAAGRIVARGDAQAFPNTVEALMELPGIGRYTAGAVASIAFGQRAPIVDGNVIRVLSRLYALGDDPKSAAGQKVFWQKAEEVLPDRSIGDFNQALMELGATVCSPENPACLICPVASDCRARREGRPEHFPKGRKKTEYRDVHLSAAVIRHQDRVLFLRRPNQGLLKGLWELPMVEGDAEALVKAWKVEVLKPLPVVRHSVLNRRLKISPFLCSLRAGGKADAIPEDARWVPLSGSNDLASSSMNRKILKHLKR